MNCVNNNGLSCVLVIVTATKRFPHFLLPVKTNDQIFLQRYVQKSEKRNLLELCWLTVFLVLFSTLVFDFVEFRFLYFTIEYKTESERTFCERSLMREKGLHKISLMSPPFEFKERGFHSHWLEPDVGRRTPKVRMGEIPVNGFGFFTGFMHLHSRSRLQVCCFSTRNKIKYDIVIWIKKHLQPWHFNTALT